jgi:hypothetical protein
VNVKPTKGSNWLLTPYKPVNKETILIACDHKGEAKTECNSNLKRLHSHSWLIAFFSFSFDNSGLS